MARAKSKQSEEKPTSKPRVQEWLVTLDSSGEWIVTKVPESSEAQRRGSGELPVIAKTSRQVKFGFNKTVTRQGCSEVVNYADVLSHAVDTFGSRANANSWLNRPNRMFANKTPLQILTEDPGAVEEELVRIDHGMFV
jgi:uncharacterized protein (DUF2384 family)